MSPVTTAGNGPKITENRPFPGMKLGKATSQSKTITYQRETWIMKPKFNAFKPPSRKAKSRVHDSLANTTNPKNELVGLAALDGAARYAKKRNARSRVGTSHTILIFISLARSVVHIILSLGHRGNGCAFMILHFFKV